MDFIETLTRWSAILAEHSPEVYASEKSVNILVETERYPFLDSLREVIREHRIDGVSAVDVSNLVGFLAGRRPYLEDIVGLRGLVVCDDAVVQPEALLSRLGGELGMSLRDSLFLAAFGLQEGRPNNGLFLGTKSVERASSVVMGDLKDDSDTEALQSECVAVRCEGVVTLVEWEDGKIEELEKPLSCEFDFVVSPHEIAQARSWSELYLDPAAATNYAYEHILSSSDRAMSALSLIRVGDNFVQSIERLGIQNNSVLLRRVFFLCAMAGCSRVHLLKGSKRHPVRESEAADAPQCEKDDGSKLWRCMVTQRGAGYRLHYWTCADGSIELVEVLLESEV